MNRPEVCLQIIDPCIECEVCKGDAGLLVNVDGALICSTCAVRGFKLECA